MATVIDALVVTLGLDAKQFNEEQKKAVKYLSDLEGATKKHGGNATRQVNEMVGAFKELQGRLLAIGALIAAGLGFNRLTQDVTKAATALSQMSATLDISAQTIDAWEKVGRTVGAASGEMTQGLAALSAEIKKLEYYGTSPLSTLMGQLGMPVIDFRKEKSDDIAKRLSEFYQGYKDKAGLQQLLRDNGLPQGMLNALALGPEELKKRLDAAKRIAPTDEEIEKFRKLTEAFGNLMNVIERLTQQALLPFINAMTKILNMLTDWLTKWATSDQTPPEAAGEGMKKLGMPELAPNPQKPGLFQRLWKGGKSLLGGEGFSKGFNEQGAGGGSGGGAGGGGGSGGPGSQSAPGAAPGGAQPTTPGAVSPGGSEFLRRERQAFADQLSDPGVRQRVMGMAHLEDGRNPTSAIESLANRFGYVNSERAKKGLPPVTVDQMLNSGFYGPINRGGLPGAVGAINSNPALAAKYGRAVDNVIGGSNTIQGFTDQGLPTDPNGWRHPQISLGTGNIFNDWNGGGRLGAGDHRNAAAYREYLMRGVAAEQAARAGARATPGLTGAQKTYEMWRDLGLGKGAATRSGGNTTNNSNTSTMNINSMNVTVPPGADPSAYADGIARHLGDWNNVGNANTGLV